MLNFNHFTFNKKKNKFTQHYINLQHESHCDKNFCYNSKNKKFFRFGWEQDEPNVERNITVYTDVEADRLMPSLFSNFCGKHLIF